jgi:hypothetical protein
MTVAAADDPLFQQGMDHLQAGEWEKAILCFRGLAEKYPESIAIQRALNEAEFKARIDAKSRVRPKQWIIPWRQIIFRLLVVLTIAAIAVQGTRLINQQVAPV